MSFTDFITDSGKRVNKESFIHLIQVALADGGIDSKELALLHRFGKRFSLTDQEVDLLIKAESDHIYSPPYELEKRFEHLYNAVEIILVDNQVSEKEKNLFRKLAVAASFSDETIPRLFDLLVEGIREDKDEHDLFEVFRKARFFRS
jgi:uncharacterized tellurite resistance protein B-like protein